MPPVFILASMTILGVSTITGVFTNSLIIVVNVIDKVKGKALSPSDLILTTMGASNILFQFIMLANDFMSFLDSELYFSDETYALFTVILNLPIYSSFWFTVCLSINYYLQIVIFTDPFLIRIKFAVSKLIPQLLVASVFIAIATGLPAAWNLYREPENVTISSIEISVPKLKISYLLPCNVLSCSLPLVLVAMANGLIVKSLVSHNSDRNTNGDLSSRAQSRFRAARTISYLLILYISFYVSEILMFVDAFPPKSLGFCICLFVIYSYTLAQAIVLIHGSPKLKNMSSHLFSGIYGFKSAKPKKHVVMFIRLKHKKEIQSAD